MKQTALRIPVTVADDPVRPEPDYMFDHCVSCGGPLESDGEQKDGVCYFCDPDEPLLMEPTEDGRQAVIYLRNR
jgi:hypothetical protein